MDLRLKEITWVRLLSLLLWTVLMMLKRGITQLTDIIEKRVFDLGVRAEEKSDQENLLGEATLLPPLSDELVFSQIWPLLHKRVNVSLLWRLRRVNRAWKKKVSTTLEWAALEFVRVDSPGYLQLLRIRGERCPPLRERVEGELHSFVVLLAENLSEFPSQVQVLQSSVVASRTIESGGESSHIRMTTEPELVATSRCRPCMCGEAVYPGCSNRQNIDGGETNWSEEEEIEAYSSSSGSSMRVYYPRYSLRNQLG